MEKVLKDGKRENWMPLKSVRGFLRGNLKWN